MMKRLSGFTLAEVLITLAIIGVVAALSIPAVISNSQQQEFRTGLRKAVSVLNSAWHWMAKVLMIMRIYSDICRNIWRLWKVQVI